MQVKNVSHLIDTNILIELANLDINFHCVFLCPRDRRSGGGILFLSCLSFFHFVIFLLSETYTLLITFEQWVLELFFYFTWVFLVIRPFRGYHYFWHCDLDLGVWPFWGENFNLAYNFWTKEIRTFIFHMSIQWDKNSPSVSTWILNLWPSSWRLAYFFNTLTLLTFEYWALEL